MSKIYFYIVENKNMIGRKGAQYKYLTHATKNGKDAENICTEGLKYQEGRANISADLIHNLTFTKDKGQWEKEHKPDENKVIHQAEEREKMPDITHIIILEKPENKMIHYGNAGAEFEENHEKKHITGYPNVWQGGRSQLAIFSSKEKINAIAPNKEENKEIKKQLVDESETGKYIYLNKEHVLMDYIPSETYKEIIFKLRKQIRKLEKIDTETYIRKIKRELQQSSGYKKNNIDIQDIAKNLLYSTVEQQITRLVRNSYLKAKKYKGYTIKNGRKENEIDPFEFETEIKDGIVIKSREDVIYEFIEKIKGYVQQVNKPDFDIIGDEVLNRYLRSSINKIYEETMK